MSHTHGELTELFDRLIVESTIGKRSTEGDPKTFQMKVRDFHISFVEDAFRYGVQRWFNDKIGGSDTKLADKVAEVSLRIPMTYDGSYKRVRIIREPANPIEAEARKLARVIVHGMLKDWQTTNTEAKAYIVDCGKSYDMPTESVDDLSTVVKAMVALKAEADDIMAQAKKNVEATAKLAKVDLASLGLVKPKG
jgi:hypothetical protein